MVRARVTSIDTYALETSLDNIIQLLKDIKSQWEAQGFRNLQMEYEDEESERGFVVYGVRPETDEEFKKRQREAKRKRETKKAEKILQEVNERKTLKELLAKYGKP